MQSPLRSATKAVVPPQPVVADSESVQVAADSGLASALVGSQPVETDSDWRDWLRPAARKEAGVPLPMTVAEGSGWWRVATDSDWANRRLPAARKETVPARSMPRVADSDLTVAAMGSESAQ